MQKVEPHEGQFVSTPNSPRDPCWRPMGVKDEYEWTAPHEQRWNGISRRDARTLHGAKQATARHGNLNERSCECLEHRGAAMVVTFAR